MNVKDQLIQKLFANQCSKKELNLLFELIHKDEANTAPEVMMTLLQQMGKVPKLNPTISDRILGAILKETVEKDTISNKQPIQLRSRRGYFQLAKVAASILFLTVAGWFVFQLSNPAEILVQTGFDERKELILPDNSHVTLNGNSTLQYFSDWSEGETRIVKLQGEAFFEVDNKAATNTKFQVLTKDLIVEVLGTVFNVNTRREATKVFLKEGKVKLNLEDTKSSQLLLEPGQVASYSAKRKSLLQPQKVATEEEVSWKDGYLTFKETPLKEILEKMSATSNFEFEISTTALAGRKFTLAFPNNNIEAAIPLLHKTTQSIILKKENKYIFQEQPKE